MSTDPTEEALGPRPEPTTEEPELHPGGVDAADDPRYGTTFDGTTTRDPRPEDNPAVEDVVPDEVTSLDDDKEQAPESAEAAEESETSSEPSG